MPRWSPAAWGAIGVTLLFMATTCWWLLADRSVQYGDAAQHVYVAMQMQDLLREGDLGGVLHLRNYYPPLTFVLGAVALFIGGMNVAVPVIAQNLIFAPLLALACFQVGRMLGGPLAGLLAVVFALGAPLVIEQFHVFMLDVPQTALVATAVWLVLASERFRRVGVAALAGLAVGIGTSSKSLTPLYLVALIAIVLARDAGWRNWRGVAAFGGVAFATGSWWYLANTERWDGLFGASLAGQTVPPLAKPALLSLANADWYLFATLNGLLFAPLFVLAAIGVGHATVRVIHGNVRPGYPTLEVLGGLAGAWLLITLMPHKDMRYTMPLIVFIAPLTATWIAQLAPRPRTAAIAALVLAVAATNVGATLGVGGTTERLLPGNRNATWGEGVPPLSGVVVYSNHNFLVSGPERNGDLLHLFRELRRDGVTAIAWQDQVQLTSRWFDPIGLLVFAEMVGLDAALDQQDPALAGPRRAIAIRELSLGSTPPCTRLSDGSGVWIRLGNPYAEDARNYCPLYDPPIYGP